MGGERFEPREENFPAKQGKDANSQASRHEKQDSSPEVQPSEQQADLMGRIRPAQDNNAPEQVAAPRGRTKEEIKREWEASGKRVTASVDDPPKLSPEQPTKSGKESPFLNALAGSVVYQAEAKILKAEHERKRKLNAERQARRRRNNPEVAKKEQEWHDQNREHFNAYMKDYMKEYRKKQS